MEPAATRPEDLLVHSQWLRALALRLATDEASADDLVQETWLAAVEHPPRHEGSRRWLARVLTNKARERRRATGRRARREASVARSEGGVPSTQELVQRLEQGQRLFHAVGELDEPYRSVVLLRYQEGLTAAEIARRTDLPAGTVRTRLRRALDELRQRMDEGPGGRAAWSVLLLPLTNASTSGPPIVPVKLAVAGAAAVLTVGLAAWSFLAPAEPGEEVGSNTAGVEPSVRPSVVATRRSASSRVLLGEASASAEADPTHEDNHAAPGPILTGRVIHAETGAAVAEAELLLFSEPGFVPVSDRAIGYTDARGTMILERPLPEPQRSGDTFLLVAVSDEGAGWVEFPVFLQREALPPLVIRVQPLRTIELVIVDAEGEPVPGARVWCRPAFYPFPSPEWYVPDDFRSTDAVPWPASFERAVTARTDAEGHVVLDRVWNHRFGGRADYAFRIEADGLGTHRYASTARAARSVWTVRLGPARGLVLHGEVISVGREPIEGARLRVGEVEVTSGPNGAFRLELPQYVPGAERTLEVEKTGYVVRRVPIQTDEPEHETRIMLGRPAPVEGIVVDENGAPVAGVGLSLLGYRWHLKPDGGDTGPDGRFRFSSATDTHHELRILSYTHPYRTWEPHGPIDLGEPEVERSRIEIVLRRRPRGTGGRFVAELYDERTGASVNAIAAILAATVEGQSWIRPDRSPGTLTGDDVPFGSWILWVNAPGYAMAHVRFDITDDEPDLLLQVPLGGPAAVEGRVVCTDGGPPFGRVRMHLEGHLNARGLDVKAGSRNNASIEIEADGSFRATFLTPGRWILAPECDTYLGEPLVLDLAADRTTKAELEVTRASLLVFEFEDEQDYRLWSVSIAYGEGGWERAPSFADEYGGFRVPVRPGRIRWRVKLLVHGKHVGPMEGSVELPPGGAERILLSVP